MKLIPLQSKDETLDVYKAFASWASTQHDTEIKRLRSDHRGEYLSNAFTSFLNQQGTERRLTTHDTPQHNGIAESLNQRLMERVRAFLIQSGLPQALWAEAANHAIWVKNRSLTKVLGNVTPLERLMGQKPNLAGMLEWGQQVWVHTDSGTKLDRHSVPAHWIGYDADSTYAHHIYWPETQKVSVERNIKFSDNSVTVRVIPLTPGKTPAPRPRIPLTPPPATIKDVPDEDDQPRFEYDDDGESKIEVEGELESATPTLVQTPARRVTPQPTNQPTWQSSRIRKPSVKMRQIQAGEGSPDGGPGNFTSEQLTSIASRKEEVHAYHASLDYAGHNPLGDPRTVKEAMASPNWPLWKAAMDSEIQSLKNAKTWRKTARLARRKVVGNRWVFHKKRKCNRLLGVVVDCTDVSSGTGHDGVKCCCAVLID